ncbi:MAG: FHA domain-containing protein [Chloroflexi bacterium]|nr:FHA domain-containing protein [Chloroflexota bacterium]
MTTEQIFLLLLRASAVLLLYLFLWGVVRAIRSELRQEATSTVESTETARLLVLDSELLELPPGLTITLQGNCTIGRARDNRLVIQEPFVSGHHAQMYFKKEHWWIRDLGSTNGTWINGKKVQAELALENGDVLRLGRWQARFEA